MNSYTEPSVKRAGNVQVCLLDKFGGKENCQIHSAAPRGAGKAWIAGLVLKLLVNVTLKC